MIRFEPVELTPAEDELRSDVVEFLLQRLPRGSFRPGLGMNAVKDPTFSR